MSPILPRGRTCIALALAASILMPADGGAATRTITVDLPPLEDQAPAPPKAARQTRQSTEWRLSADSMTALNEDEITEASGDVTLRNGDTTIRADFARFFTKTNWAYLSGNVTVRSGRDVLTAEEGEFDLNNDTGTMKQGRMFLDGPHMYVSGDRIIKHEGDTYSFEGATFTTCDAGNPAWRLSADRGRLEIDGYAHLYGANLAVKSVKAIPVPYLILPLKTTRQSGLILPDVGYSSKRGMTYTQPLYWVIDDVSDLTLYSTFMSHVGGGATIEYRAKPDKNTATWMALTYVNDRRDDTSGAYSRTNDNRFWLRGMLDGTVGDTPWRYRADVDLVSDHAFLSDFNTGQIGHDKTNSELGGMFHRTLRENNSDKKRLSQAMIYRNWARFGLSASMRYEQDPRLGHEGRRTSSDTTTQVLPQIDAFLYKGAVVEGLPLDVEARLTSGYMYRRNGMSALRTSFTPSVSMPLDIRYASVIPSFTLHQTWYTNRSMRNKDVRPAIPGGRYDALSRDDTLTGTDSTIPEFQVKAFTEASNVWTFDAGPSDAPASSRAPFDGWVGLRHTIQPEVGYRYLRKELDQQDNPFFDDDDRMLPANELTYSVTNILTRKKAVRTAGRPGKDASVRTAADAEPSFSYMDILRWKLEWGYDFDENSRTRELRRYERRPMKDIMNELTAYPLTWLSVTSKTYFSPYTGKLTRQDIGASVSYEDIVTWRCDVDYRSRDYNLRQALRSSIWDSYDIGLTTATHLLKNSVTVRFAPHWYLRAYDSRNLRRSNGSGLRGKGYEKGIILGYSEQCWRVYLEMTDDGHDKSYSVNFEIPGLLEKARKTK